MHDNDENRFQALAEAMPILVWIAKPDGRLSFINQAMADYTGRDIDELVENGWLSALHPDDRDATLAHWEVVRRQGRDYVNRFRVLHRDGTYHWMITWARPFRDSAGEIVRWYGSSIDIQEEKLLEDRAERLSRHLADTLESISDGFVILDGEGRILFANEIATGILGQERERCHGRLFYQLLTAALGAEADGVIHAAQRGQQRSVHQVYFHPRGRWLELRFFPHEGGSAVSLRDITEGRRNQQLQAMEARVLSMIMGSEGLKPVLEEVVLSIEQVMPQALASILLLDEDGIHLRQGAAPSLPEVYSRAIEGQPIGPRAGSCGTAMFRREPVVVADITADPLWEHYRDVARVEGQGLRACWSTPVMDGDGRVLGSFAIYHRAVKAPEPEDILLIRRISHLVAVTIQNHRNEMALRESEARFRQMDEAMDDVFWMEDLAQQRLIYLSPTFEKMFGYPCGRFDDKPDSWSQLIHPEDRQRIRQAVESVHHTWELPPEGLRYRMIRADGEVRWVNDRAFLIRDSQGQPWRLTGVIRDITGQLALERQLRESQRMESLGQLTGGIAHDFNNLLTVILGNLEVLGDHLAGVPHVLSLVQTTESAAQRGADLIQRLLAFARRRPLEPRPVDLDGLIRDMQPLLTRTLGPHIDIHFRQQPGLWLAMVDGTQLESALLNLCLNARDAMPSGGRLVIEAANLWLDGSDAAACGGLRPGPYVQLAVSDTGTGIAAENLDHVFEPFFTTKEPGRGTGLGLAMVYGFARQSQGYVSVSSEPGSGATFHLYLPRAENPREQVQPARPGQSPVARGEWILLAEDDNLVREYALGQLEALGYRVHVATDGHDALDILHRGEPVDLLFTDVVMPGGISGPELARKAHELRPGLRILYTSGYAEDAVIHGGSPDSDILLLPKPYRRAELARRLRQVLERDPPG